MIRAGAAVFPEEAFDFVRDGLKHTVTALHGAAPARAARGGATGATAGSPSDKRHVTGQQLCVGLRDLALQRWGMLAILVLRKWGIRRTDDFGAIVYAMIERQELRASEGDSIEDFRAVYEFDEAFGAAPVG